MRIRHFFYGPALLSFFVAGCGKPKQMGGPPADMPTLSVVVLVRESEVADTLLGVGQVEAVEQIHLVSEVDATLVESKVEDGARVLKDEVLYRFDDHKYISALAQAEARLTLAKAELERAKTLRADNTVPQADLDRAEAEYRAADAAVVLAKDNLEDTVVRAPISGVLDDRPVTQGQYCSRGQDLGTIVQIDPLDVTFNTPERDANRLAIGQSIEFKSDAVPGVRFKGEVTYLSPQLDSAARTLRAKARISGADGRLRPGMFGSVEVVLKRRAGVIRIPESGVMFHGNSAQVVVMNDESRANFRPVTIGRRGDSFVEIIKGLKAGERVVIEGHQKLMPNGKIQVSDKSAAFGVQPEAVAPAGDAPTPSGTKLPAEQKPAGK
jgi:RND family efflux transporter MFP subunit